MGIGLKRPRRSHEAEHAVNGNTTTFIAMRILVITGPAVAFQRRARSRAGGRAARMHSPDGAIRLVALDALARADAAEGKLHPDPDPALSAGLEACAT